MSGNNLNPEDVASGKHESAPTPAPYLLTISLPAFVYDALAERAQAAGQPVEIYVADLLGQATTLGEPAEMIEAQMKAEQLRDDLAVMHQVAAELAEELGQVQASELERQEQAAEQPAPSTELGRTPGAAEGVGE